MKWQINLQVKGVSATEYNEVFIFILWNKRVFIHFFFNQALVKKINY